MTPSHNQLAARKLTATNAVRYQICTRCIMDTTDENIVFDEKGVCNHCKPIMDHRDKYWLTDERGQKKLDGLIAKIKEEGKGRPYDCIMGLSGGVDSSYLAMKASDWGLRILAVHVDAGWNSELAVKNIELIVSKLGLELHTYVIDWDEMRDLQLAFLKSGVPNQDIPQDHSYFAALYRETVKYGIRYVLTGSNQATESILPTAWGYSARDLTHIRAIHKRFGTKPLRNYPHLGFLYTYFILPKIFKVKIVEPLNFMPYNQAQVIEELERRFGWRYYGGKHYESRFTKFFQSYYLPVKFGFNKRRAHIASLVASGQMTRNQALAEMQKPLYEPAELEKDKQFVIKKLGLSEAEFQAYLDAPNHAHREYPTNEWMHRARRAETYKEKFEIVRRHLFGL